MKPLNQLGSRGDRLAPKSPPLGPAVWLAAGILLATLTTSVSQPIITVHPANQLVGVGGNVTFSVVATGTNPKYYQWRFNEVNLPGKTSTSLVLNNVQLTNSGAYTVVVTNVAGAVTSVVATLTVEANFFRQWVQIPTDLANTPTNRVGHAMVFDERRGVVVMHGGMGIGLQTLADTWEWDGRVWTLASTNGPRLVYHGMAYDAARGVTVLYGGQKQYSYPNSRSETNTWEWDGQSWTKVETASGEALCLVGMAYDVERQKVIRHGGVADVWDCRIGSTWEFDGQTWTQIADGLIRGAQGMVYDTVRRKMLLFGGFILHIPVNCPSDTWELDGNQWRQVATNAPPGRRDAQEMVFDPHRGVAVLFGGDYWDEQFPLEPPHFIVYGDTWERDGAQWRQINLSGPVPAPRYGHAMAYDPKRRKVVLFAGLLSHSGPRVNDTWEYGLPPLQLTGLDRQPDGSLRIQWTGEAPPYQLQSCTNLNAGDWQNEGAPTDQTSATVQPDGTAKFFRVLSQ